MFLVNYLVVVLLCYFSAVTLSAILFFKDKKKLHRILLIYFLLLFLSAFFDYINYILSNNNSNFSCLVFPFINVAIYVLEILFSFMICTPYISSPHMPKNIFLFVFVSLLIILPLLIGIVCPLSIFIATLADDIYFIYLGFLTTKPLQQINFSGQHFLVKNKNFGITLILGATITLMGNVYNFFRWPISQNYFFFSHGYNINNDILSILLCFWLLKFFIQKISVISSTIYNTQSFDKFCSEFTLTSREKELFAELLNSLTYQEIADKLYISNGTVKAHFHNIFIKTNTKNKHNLLQFYQKYTDKFS